MTRRAKCRNTEHDDKPIRGSTRERCTKCGDEFPCKRACEHLDCMQQRGEPPPEWADYEFSPLDPGDRQAQKMLHFGARTGMGPKQVLADHAAVMEYTREVGCFVDEEKVRAAEASIAKLEAEHPEIAEYRINLTTDSAAVSAGSRLHATADPNKYTIGPDHVVVQFGCADETTGHVTCSHVMINGETTLHVIRPDVRERIMIDVADGKLVLTNKLVLPPGDHVVSIDGKFVEPEES